MFRRAAGFLMTACLGLVLAACGGGDDSFTSSAGTTGGGGDGSTATAITLLSNSPTLSSDPSSSVGITAIVSDAANNVLGDVPVDFVASSGLISGGGNVRTDEFGRAQVNLSPGPDQSNRIITVTALSGVASASIAIEVIGTQVTITGPTTLALSDTGRWTINLRDANGNGIANQSVSVVSANGNLITPVTGSLVTNTSGIVEIDVRGDVGGDDTLTASALGEASTASFTVSNDVFAFTTPDPDTEIPLNTPTPVTVQWIQGGTPQVGEDILFSTTRGTIGATATTNGAGEATVNVSADNAGFATINATPVSSSVSAARQVEFIATVPDSLDLQASPSAIDTNQSSTITATVRDPNGNLVKNAVVNFNVSDQTSGSLTTSVATTDNLGRATTIYNATSVPSSSSGVLITATVAGTVVSGTTTLTVGGRSLRITLGSANEITQPNPAIVEQFWTLIVTDADGAPVGNANVQLTLLATEFFKGFWFVDVVNDVWTTDVQAECANEDSNFDGQEQPGEDLNGNGVLDPSNPATTVIDGEVRDNAITDASGTVNFRVRYPESNAPWVRLLLRATVSVSGTEQDESRTFVPLVPAEDVTETDGAPPGGQIDAPWGRTADCTSTD